jgi:uncharacterized protein (TIGR02302 family)
VRRQLAYYWTLGWSFISLLLERLWRSFWPFVSILAVFAALSLTGIIFMFGKTGHMGLLLFFIIAAVLSAFYLGARFQWPKRRDVERCIEAESGLRHRPLEMQHDKPVQGTSDAALALWHKQQKASQQFWTRLKIWRPRPDTPRQDPYGLRHAALLLLVIGLVVSPDGLSTRIKDGLRPPMEISLPFAKVALDVWIEPPAYTSAPAVFLATAQQGRTAATEANVPANSTLKVRVAKSTFAPRLSMAGTKGHFTKAGDNNYTLEMPLTQGGLLKIKQGWFLPIGTWPVTVTPDAAPEISILLAAPKERGGLKVTYSAKDDYGIKSLRGTIRPVKPDDPWISPDETIWLDVPFIRNSSRDSEDFTLNLSAHKLAGSLVQLVLTAEDDAGNITDSAPNIFLLPERVFKHPTAARLNTERKRLMMFDDPLTTRIIARVLANIANRPALINDDKMVFLGLVIAVKRLGYDSDAESINSVVQLLWDLSLQLEDGGLARARDDLTDALQRLSQALSDPNTSKEKLEELIQDVNNKIRQYMRAMANEMQQRGMMADGKQQQASPEIMQQLMKHMDMEALMEQMRQMSEGDTREQMQRTAEFLKNAFENMDMDRMEEMQKQQQQTMEQLQALQDLIHAQQSLVDKANKAQNPQETKELAPEQGKIRKDLGDIMRQLGEKMELPDNFADADQSMKAAQEKLAQGNQPEGAKTAKEALDHLQQGMDSVMQKMAEQMKQVMLSFGFMPSRGNFREGADPLGRGGEDDGNGDSDVRLPDESERRRVQDIIRELRGRSNNWERPKVERDYIDRLLDTLN